MGRVGIISNNGPSVGDIIVRALLAEGRKEIYGLVVRVVLPDFEAQRIRRMKNCLLQRTRKRGGASSWLAAVGNFLLHNVSNPIQYLARKTSSPE
jgi:hypothetical protein